MPTEKLSVFETLNNINVNEHTEKKGQLTYLSWAWAYQIVKKHYPLMQYKIYENDLGFNYHTDGNTAWVKVSTTIEDLEHIEYLPVLDYKNQSIPKDQLTSMNVNTATQRALTKSLARHGLGLYIYSGEDLPNEEAEEAKKPKMVTPAQISTIEETANLKGLTTGQITVAWKIKSLSELQASNYDSMISWLQSQKASL